MVRRDRLDARQPVLQPAQHRLTMLGLIAGLVDHPADRQVPDHRCRLDRREPRGLHQQARAGPVGACWAFVRDRFAYTIYGSYPVEGRWRANLFFVLGRSASRYRLGAAPRRRARAGA
jgi:hypothetical protein